LDKPAQNIDIDYIAIEITIKHTASQ